MDNSVVRIRRGSGLKTIFKNGKIGIFHVLAAVLLVVLLVLLVQLPKNMASSEELSDNLNAAASAYYDAQAENNKLRNRVAQIDTDEFVEQTARREYGYCWYGEIIYEVENLDELQDDMEFEVYGSTN